MIGILLMGYGSPEKLEDVAAYYTNIRGSKPPPEKITELKSRYKKIGGSPLPKIIQKQAEALESELNSTEKRFRVYVGMKNWDPFIERAILKMEKDGIKKAVAITLAPHYSKISIGGYIKSIEKTQKNKKTNISINCIKNWHLNPLFLESVAEKIRDGMEMFKEIPIVLFTAHSLPEKTMKRDDPYIRQLEESCKALVARLNIGKWKFAFQSAGMTSAKWIGPDIKDVLSKLAEGGEHNVLVCPIGFVSDHLEVLYDIDIDCKDYARGLGMRLERTQSLNTSPLFIRALASIATSSV